MSGLYVCATDRASRTFLGRFGSNFITPAVAVSHLTKDDRLFLCYHTNHPKLAEHLSTVLRKKQVDTSWINIAKYNYAMKHWVVDVVREVA